MLLVLLSGGGSANWIAPAGGITFEQKQKLTRALLRSGAPIGEINTVRKHLSRIKGGRLARAGQRAEIVTLAISDVPRDDPSAIASGPTVPDPTTLADARASSPNMAWRSTTRSAARWTIRTTKAASRATPPLRTRISS